MSDDMNLGAEISAAMGSTSSPSGESSSASTVDTSAASTDSATTPPAQASTTSTTPTAPEGPIPFPVHKTALENARAKAVAEYQQAHWAKDYNADEVRTLVQFRDALRADPAATLGTEIAELIQHPTYGPQLRSVLARHLGASGRQAAPQGGTLPVIQLDNGQEVDLNALKSEWMEEARSEMAPAQQAAKELADAKAHYVNTQKANTFAAGAMSEFTALPQFKEHAAQIKAELGQTRLETDHPAEVTLAVHRIYNRIVGPKLGASARQAVLSEQTLKAQTNTVSPHHQSASAPKSYGDLSWADAFKAEIAGRR